MTQANSGLGEKALNKVAEIALASQLDESESLSVTVQTDPGQLAQGSVDSVSIDGTGLVMQQDLRMEKLEMELHDISVNPLSAIFGKIELTQPTVGTANVTLTEADINRAFSSEYINSKLQGLKVQADGQPVTIDAKSVKCSFLPAGKIGLETEIMIEETRSLEKVSFTALPQIDADGSGISLQQIEYPSQHEFSPDLTNSLVNKANEILNLRNFDVQGMSLQIQQLKIESGVLQLQAKAKVDKFPS